MLDCGIHPGFSGERSLPYVDHIDVESVDVMLVTHFHLDHCAAVPWVVAKTKFKVYSVQPLQDCRHIGLVTVKRSLG